MKSKVPKALIFIVSAALLLCSCATGDISCGVDGENNAFLFLSLQADWSGATDDMKEEIRRGFIAIADHFENKLGFEVEQSITKVSADLNMRLVRPAATPEEAFQELESILTDEALTPFTEVKMQVVPGEHFSGYRVDVTLDPEGWWKWGISIYTRKWQEDVRPDWEKGIAGRDPQRRWMPYEVYGASGDLIYNGTLNVSTMNVISTPTAKTAAAQSELFFLMTVLFIIPMTTMKASRCFMGRNENDCQT